MQQMQSKVSRWNFTWYDQKVQQMKLVFDCIPDNSAVIFIAVWFAVNKTSCQFFYGEKYCQSPWTICATTLYNIALNKITNRAYKEGVGIKDGEQNEGWVTKVRC